LKEVVVVVVVVVGIRISMNVVVVVVVVGFIIIIIIFIFIIKFEERFEAFGESGFEIKEAMKEVERVKCVMEVR